jgi:hypothetical protein
MFHPTRPGYLNPLRGSAVLRVLLNSPLSFIVLGLFCAVLLFVLC